MQTYFSCEMSFVGLERREFQYEDFFVLQLVWRTWLKRFSQLFTLPLRVFLKLKQNIAMLYSLSSLTTLIFLALEGCQQQLGPDLILIICESAAWNQEKATRFTTSPTACYILKHIPCESCSIFYEKYVLLQDSRACNCPGSTVLFWQNLHDRSQSFPTNN